MPSLPPSEPRPGRPDLPIHQSSFSPSQASRISPPLPASHHSPSPRPSTPPSASTDIPFLHHYITQCEHLLHYYHSLHPSSPPPSPLPPSSSPLSTPLWLSSTPTLSSLPALLTAYESRVIDLTTQLTSTLHTLRSREAAVTELEGQLQRVMDRWQRAVEDGGVGGGGEGDGGGVSEELENYREQVELLKQREAMKAQAWDVERSRMEGLIAAQRERIDALERAAATPPSSAAELLRQVQGLQVKVDEGMKAAESLRLELSVERGERVRAEGDVKRAKAECVERAAEGGQARRVLSSMERRLAEAEAREHDLGQQLMAAETEKERVWKEAEVRALQVEVWKQRAEAVEAATQRTIDEARAAARAEVGRVEEQLKAGEIGWKEQRKRLEVEVVELSTKGERLQREVGKAEERLARLQSEWMRRVDDGVREVTAARVTVMEAQEERRAEKERLDAEVEEVRAVRAGYVREMDALRTQNRKLVEREERVQHQLRLVEQRCEDTQQVEARRDKELQQLQRLHSALVQRLQEKLEEAQRGQTQAKEEGERAIAQLRADIDHSTAQLTDLHTQHARTEEERRQLQAALTQATADVDKEKRGVAHFSERLTEVERDERERRAQCEGLRAEVVRLTAAMAAAAGVEAELRAGLALAVREREGACEEAEVSKEEMDRWRERAERERVKVLLARRALEERAATLVSRCQQSTPLFAKGGGVASALERTVLMSPESGGSGLLPSSGCGASPARAGLFTSPGQIQLPPTSLPVRSLVT